MRSNDFTCKFYKMGFQVIGGDFRIILWFIKSSTFTFQVSVQFHAISCNGMGIPRRQIVLEGMFIGVEYIYIYHPGGGGGGGGGGCSVKNTYKLPYTYIERYDSSTTLKFQDLLNLRAHTRFWTTHHHHHHHHQSITLSIVYVTQSIKRTTGNQQMSPVCVCVCAKKV